MPELQEIDDWAAINEISDPAEKLAGFSNYVKGEFFKEGLGSEEMRETFKSINDSMVVRAAEEGVGLDHLGSLLQSKAPTFEEKMSLVDMAFSGIKNESDKEKIRDYNAFSSVLQKQPEESGFLTDKVEKLRVLAEEAVNNSYEDAVQWALNNSAIPFARVELSNGDVQLQAGDAAIGLSASESYQKSLAAGTVTPNDMEMIFRLTQKDENGYEAFRHLNLQEASAYVSKLSGGKISEDAEATPNSGSSLIKRSIKSLVTSYASAGKLGGVIDSDRLDVLVTTIRSVDESAYNYSQKDLKASLEFLIGSEAMLSGAARFDKDNLENNIKHFGYGSKVMHQKLLTSPVKFEGAIQGFGEKEKESLRSQRELTRESLFSDFSDALARSTYGDEWSSFYADRKGSLSDPDILDSFIENTEYDFSNKLQHIFLSVGEGFTDLAWAIGTVGGSKEARDYMVENLRDRQARATVAELFGQGFGLGTELSVTVAPIIADIVATAGITVATGGLGSAAVVAAVGAKNVFKAGVKTAVRTTLKRTAKKAPLRRAGGGQWRGTTGKRITPSEFYKEFGETLTKDFGKSYSKIASSKVVGRTAMFISAGSRSGAMTYASVYDVLSRAPEGERLSDDEIHEKALVVGATAFALTGSITLGFSVIGKGGFEDFIMQGATTKQVTNVINRLARKELSNETQQKVLNSVLARGRKELLGKTTGFKKVIRSGFWESLEEGLDEGVNTLLQAGATDSELSFTEFRKSVQMGAMYGGIIGSGMSIASSGYRKLTQLDSSPASLLFERQAENNFIKQGEKELKDSGSPVAAKEFAKQVREAPNRVAQSNKPKETKEEVDAAGVEADAAGVEAEAAGVEAEAAAAADADEVYAEVEAEEAQAYDEARADADADAADAAAEVDAEVATVLYYLENANEEEIAEAIDAEKDLDNETAPETLDDSDSQPAQTLLDFQEDKGLTDDELQQAVEDYAEESESGVPKKNVPVATKQKQQDNEDATASRLEELLALGYPINVADSAGRYGIPTGTKEFLKSRAAGFNATLEEQQKDKDSPYYIRTKEDVAKEHGVDVADIVEYALGFKHSDKYLFTNDPKATDQLIKKGHKPRVSKDSDYNKELFVVENGLVVGINKPVFSPNSTKAKDAKVEGVKDIVKKRITFNGSVNPTDTKIKLNAAGLFSNVIGRIKAEFSIDEEGSLVKKSISGKVKVEKPPTRKSDETDDDYLERVNQLELEKAMSLTNKSDYILDGEMTFKEALALFNKWVNENYEKLVESGQSEVAGQFRRASGIDRASFREQDVRDLMPHVVMEFVADLQHTIILAAVNAEVGSFIANGVVSEENIVALSDSLVESGLFNQKEIEATLSGLGKLQFESGTTKDSDLLAKSETPKQKLASFLYYTLSGTSGIGNPFSNPEFKRDVDSTTKNKKLKKGWENRIISRAVESMLAKEEFRPKEGDSFPNLPAIISKVGTRVRKREQKSTWQKESGVELNDNTQPVSPDPVETTTTYNEIRSQATNGINNEFKGLPPTEQNAAKESLVKLVIATETTPEYKPTEADLKGQDFREFLSAFLGRLTLKKGENSAVLKEGSPAHNFFSSVFDSLPPRLKNTLVVFGFDPPATFDADTLATTRGAQDLILDSLNELTAPNLVSFKDAQKARDLNNVTIERLGLVDGDPESVINALEEIARNGVDESHRLMAELLLRDKPLIRKTRFRIVDNDRSKSAGSFVPFENESHRVSINVAGYYGSGIESVLIHEFIHAATYNLSRSDSLSTKQKAALKRLEGLRQLVKKSYVKSGMNLPSVENGVSSIDELLATIFTSNTFQEEVRSLPDGISFRRILNALKSLFGIKPESRLDKAFNDLVDFLNMDVAPKPRAIDSLGKRPKTSDADDVFQKKIEELESSSREGKNQRFSSFGRIQSDVTLTAEQEAIADELLDDVIKTTVPADVPIIELDEERTAEMFAARPKALFVVQMAELGGQEVATIFVNRPRLQQVMFGLTNEVTNGVHAKMILESILNEEITHAAELNVIPIEQIDAAASGMSVSDFDGIIESYTEDEALRQSLKEGVSKGDVEILRQMVGEKLRMEVQKINRGYTTEQDKAFYMSNPNFAKVMFRYLKGFFKRMYAKYNLRKDNAEMSRMVNQMSHEIQLLRSGVFHIRDTMEFDIAMPDYTGDFLNQRFSATFEDEALKEITPETTDEEIYNRFPFLKGFELPVGVFKDGKYTKNGKIKKFLNGELDPRILELRRQSDAVNMAVKGRAENLMGSAMKLIQEDPEATNQLLADFMGRPDSTQVSDEYRLYRHKVSGERMIREKKEKGRPLNDSERDLIVKEEVDDAIAAENVRLLDSAKFKKATARQKLMSNNPELHESLNELRLLLDAISKKFSSEFDSHGELRAVVDANLGVYIIRSYRAFLEEGYMDKLIKITKGQAVAGDAQLVRHFEQVYDMFNEQYHESFASSERAKERKAEVPDKERTKDAELIKTSEETVASLKEQGIDPIRGAILEYLYSLDPNSRFRDKSAPLATSPTKSLVDQMKARKSIPEVFRKFLGQYDEADVMDNVLRSISMVSRATAQESFTANIIKLGRPDNKKDQFVYTLDEVRALGLDLDLVNLRTGARAATSDIQPEKLSDEVEAKASKTSQYYVPREMYADMQKQFQRSSEGNLSTDKEVINKALELAKLGVGVSLASKTLFSVGFYLRNALGNVAFFAPLVGLSPLKVIAAHRKIADMYSGNLKGLDNYMANLVRLNLVHGDMTSQTIMELMEGTTSLKDLESEQQELTSKLDKLLEAGKKVSDKTVAPVMKRMVALSQAIDSVYKIAYFENEMAVLKKARDSDRERDIAEGKGYNLSDEALQVKAAHIVRGTSQSYVDAYEIVKYATGKYSFLLPPFIRFRTDILRILLDGLPKQINSELRSDNPVIKSRGIKRLAGMSLVVVGAGMLAPVATRILAGLGKEEEEMLRNSLPDWQKNAALLFTGPDKFIDMTYVNPVSGVTNTTLAAISDVFDGRPIDGFFKGLSMLTQEYGGGQIVTSALLDVKANRDTRTGEQIHGGMDGGFGAFIDMTSYVFREAYAPRGGTALYRAGKAALGDQPLDDQKTTAMILAREFYPFKPRTIEWERVFQKSISSTKKESLRARNSIKKIMSSSSLTDWEINSAVDDFVEGQFEASAKLSRAMAAAKKMGVSSRQISSSLKYSKVSEDYANLTRRGIYERPSIPKSLVEDVRVSGDTTLRDRLLKANKRLRESPRYMRFDD